MKRKLFSIEVQSLSIGQSLEYMMKRKKLPPADEMPAYADYLGLNQPPEVWFKALQQHPDEMPPPQKLVRWTDEALAHNSSYPQLNHEDQLLYNQLHALLLEKKKVTFKDLQQLEALKANNPGVPSLAILEMAMLISPWRKNKREKQLKQLLADYPDYLFARTNLALFYAQHKQIDRVAEVLQGKYELSEHLQRSVYHYSEVRSFYAPVCIYMAWAGHLRRSAYAFSLVLAADDEDDMLALMFGHILKHSSYEQLEKLRSEIKGRKLKRLR